MSTSASPLAAPPARDDMPEKGTRFVHGKAAKAAPLSSCCSPKKQTTCCAPTEKVACCGPSPSASVTSATSCGCK